MTKSWQSIVECLREEISEYGQLLNLFAAQQDLIFKRKPNEVLELSSKIHAQVEILETYSNTLTIDESKDQYSQIMDFLNNNTCVIGDTPQGTIIYQIF